MHCVCHNTTCHTAWKRMNPPAPTPLLVSSFRLFFSSLLSSLLFSALLCSTPHLVLLRRVEAKGHIIHRSRLWDHPRQQSLKALEPEETGGEPAVEGGARVEALRIEGHQIEKVGGARAGVA